MRIVHIYIFLAISICNAPLVSQQPIRNIGDENARISDFATTSHNKVVFYPVKNTLHACDIQSGIPLRSFEGPHTDDILCIDVADDSTILISGGKDSKVVVWDLNTGHSLWTFNYHSSPVLSMDISNDLRYLCTGDMLGNIFIWDFFTEQLLQVPNKDSGEVTCLVFTPDSETIIWGSSTGTIFAYSIIHQTITEFPKGHNNWIRNISLSEDGKQLFSGGDDKSLIRWNISSIDNTKIISKKKFSSWVTAFDVLPDDSGSIIGLINGSLVCNIKAGDLGAFYLTYNYNLNTPIRKLLLIKDGESVITVIAATIGEGLKIIPLSKMKSKS